MKAILNILDPRTFEIESSGWDSIDEMEDTINSGSDVPYASSVRPTTASEIPKAFASFAENRSVSQQKPSTLPGIKQGC